MRCSHNLHARFRTLAYLWNISTCCNGKNTSLWFHLSNSIVWIARKIINKYLLTPCSRVILEKLTGFQLVKKFPAFYGTRMFITSFTSVRHLSLFWDSSIQSMLPHTTSWKSILILSSHLRLGLPSGLFLSSFLTNTLYTSVSTCSLSII